MGATPPFVQYFCGASAPQKYWSLPFGPGPPQPPKGGSPPGVSPSFARVLVPCCVLEMKQLFFTSKNFYLLEPNRFIFTYLDIFPEKVGAFLNESFFQPPKITGSNVFFSRAQTVFALLLFDISKIIKIHQKFIKYFSKISEYF